MRLKSFEMKNMWRGSVTLLRGQELTALRSFGEPQAELAVDFRERGVVGFDLAGEEGGYPPKKHVEAFHYIQRQNFNITIHAGEGLERNRFGRQFNTAEHTASDTGHD
jgi:adenosine deaminase